MGSVISWWLLRRWGWSAAPLRRREAVDVLRVLLPFLGSRRERRKKALLPACVFPRLSEKATEEQAHFNWKEGALNCSSKVTVGAGEPQCRHCRGLCL